MARTQADATPGRFQELEVVEPVVYALQQDRRYPVARQLLLGKQGIALLRTKAEEVVAVNGVKELVGEWRLVQRKEVRAMRDPHQLCRQVGVIEQEVPDPLGAALT